MKTFWTVGIMITGVAIVRSLIAQDAKLPGDLKSVDEGWCHVFTWGTNQYPNRAWIAPRKGWTYQSIATQTLAFANALSPSQIVSKTPVQQGSGVAMKQETKDASLGGCKGRQIVNNVYDSAGNKGFVVALVLSDGTNGWQCYIGAETTNDIAIGFTLFAKVITKANKVQEAIASPEAGQAQPQH